MNKLLAMLFFTSALANGNDLLNELTFQMEAKLDAVQTLYIERSHLTNSDSIVKQSKNKIWQPTPVEDDRICGTSFFQETAPPIIKKFYTVNSVINLESWTPLFNNYKKEKYWVIAL